MIERRITAARFPATKSLDSFDYKAIPSLNKALTMELARCEFVDRRENVIALGPSGTGKTHVSLGLGLAACQKGLKVRFTTAASLVRELIEAADERRLQRLQSKHPAWAAVRSGGACTIHGEIEDPIDGFAELGSNAVDGLDRMNLAWSRRQPPVLPA
jgi:hypothetical protein